MADFKKKLDRVEPTVSKAPIGFMEAAELWLGSMEAHLKPSSLLRREVSIKQLRKVLGKSTVRSITRNQ